MGEQAEPAQARLPLDPSSEVVRQADRLEGRAKDKLPRVKDEALVVLADLDQALAAV